MLSDSEDAAVVVAVTAEGLDGLSALPRTSLSRSRETSPTLADEDLHGAVAVGGQRRQAVRRRNSRG